MVHTEVHALFGEDGMRLRSAEVQEGPREEPGVRQVHDLATQGADLREREAHRLDVADEVRTDLDAVADVERVRAPQGDARQGLADRIEDDAGGGARGR